MATVGLLQSPVECPHCGMVVLCPDWSENVEPQRVANIWHCQVCGNEFETIESGVATTLSDAELVQAYFPNLLVA
jgi:transcription elongation factor Elf1